MDLAFGVLAAAILLVLVYREFQANRASMYLPLEGESVQVGLVRLDARAIARLHELHSRAFVDYENLEARAEECVEILQAGDDDLTADLAREIVLMRVPPEAAILRIAKAREAVRP
jgi:hypothetical protein